MRIIALLLISLSAHAASTSYFIANAGNDANNGTTTGTPWKSFAHVTNGSVNFVSGDTVFLNRGDTWAEQFTMPTNGLIVDAYGSGTAPTIDGNPGAKIRFGVLCSLVSNTVTRNLIIKNIGGYAGPNDTGACWQTDGYSNRVENCTMDHHLSDDGIAANDGGTGAVSNCIIINMFDQAFTMHSSAAATTLIVQSCLISNCNEAFTHSGGNLFQTVNDCVILDNVLGDNVLGAANCYSVFNRCWFKGKVSSSQYKFSETISNTVFNYCLFDASLNTSQSSPQITVSSGPLVMNNCVLYGGQNQVGAITINAGATLAMTNCIIFDWWRMAFITDPGTLTLDHCITNSIVTGTQTVVVNQVSTSDPKFASASSKNFHILPTSPALKTGLNLGLTLDLEDVAVGNPPNVGVYETILPAFTWTGNINVSGNVTFKGQ
jgi:hypothetical protein